MTRTPNIAHSAVIGCSLAIALFAPLTAAHAATETVLYSFTGATGENPQAGLIRDKSGNLYGTTERGGAGNFGTVFRLAPGGAQSVLLSFDSTGGANPYDRLIADRAGNLYGTTAYGGAYGYGVVFKLAPDGTENVLHSFSGPQSGDGANPADGLIADKKGNLFGTTSNGGMQGAGTIFEISKKGLETLLYSFGDADANFPDSGLLSDDAGNYYGTTFLGGAHGSGAVFKLAADGKETVLYSFAGGSDGQYPVSSLVMDKKGNLYGTTLLGGTGSGTIFRLSPDGTESILHSFGGTGDGISPVCTLLMDKKGNLYGTTGGGGAHGDGTIFKLSRKGEETILYSFAGGSDGANPEAGLIADKTGNLYGTTSQGGTSNDGTVFRVTP